VHVSCLLTSVRVANRHTCAMFSGVPLRSRVGYLAAISAVDSPVGTVNCPWLVDVERGQRVNLSVHGSGLWSSALTRYGSESPGGDTQPDCLLRLVIDDDNKTVSFPVCAHINGLVRTYFLNLNYMPKTIHNTLSKGMWILNIKTIILLANAVQTFLHNINNHINYALARTHVAIK